MASRKVGVLICSHCGTMYELAAGVDPQQYTPQPCAVIHARTPNCAGVMEYAGVLTLVTLASHATT